MSYRIDYGKDPIYVMREKRKKWWRIMTVLGIMAAGAGLGIYAVQVVGLQGLLPGDPVVTGAALDHLVEGWRSGLSVGEAFTVFCEEIVAHAQILR